MKIAPTIAMLFAGALAVGACAIGAPATRSDPATAPGAPAQGEPATNADESASAPLAPEDGCALPGELMHWRADFCLAQVGTDDVIAAGPCLESEGAVRFRSTCAGKHHYKRRLCEVVIAHGSRAGTVDACLADPDFVGPTVRNGGA